MPEHHCTVQRQQALRLRGVRGRLRDPKLLRCTPQERKVADRFCRRQEQQPPRVAREPRQPAREALLDPRGQRQRRRQTETAGELGGRQPARELQERERIPACLGDDPLEHGLVQPRHEDGLQQRPRIPAAQRLHAELREAAPPSAHLTRRKRERDPLRQQAARHERERSRRCAVEPLRVVDDAQQRLLLGSFGEEAENREPDEKRARRLSGAEPEGDAERVTLRIRETLAELEKRRTELLQRRVVELISPSTPAVRTTRKSWPASTAYSSSAVLPTPGSPCTTRTAPWPSRAVSSSRSSTARSRCLPTNRPACTLTTIPAACHRVTDYGFPGFDRPAAAATIRP